MLFRSEANIRRQIEHGARAAALDAVFDKLGQRVQGLSRDALSPAEQATRDLGTAWSGFVDRVAGSDLVIGAIERLAAALRSIAGLIGPAGSATPSLAAIDAQLAAVSGDIPGANATAARLRRDQAEARVRLLAQTFQLRRQHRAIGRVDGERNPDHASQLFQAASSTPIDSFCCSRTNGCASSSGSSHRICSHRSSP